MFKRSSGMTLFLVLWAGQMVSMFGTAMSRFALMIWAYRLTGEATALALLGFFNCFAYVAVSLVAGPLVDRWDRKKVMLLSDLGAGLMTLMILILNQTGGLAVWHLYLLEALAGGFEAFQSPASAATISLLVPANQLTRANGLRAFARFATQGLAPVCAGLLLDYGTLNWVLIGDLTTLVVALSSLALLPLPRPAPAESAQTQLNWKGELSVGFRTIFANPGLSGLMWTYFFINFFGTLTYMAILSPMILARSGNNTLALSSVQTAMGIGGVVGSLLIIRFASDRQRVKLFLVSTLLSFMICDFMLAVGQSVPFWLAAGFLSAASIPFVNSPYIALWQAHVPNHLQGRVFSARDLFAVASQPVGFLLGGLLADHLFEPALQAGGALAGPLGWLVGVGPGAGMGAMFLCTCLGGTLTGILGLLNPGMRRLDAPEEPATPEACLSTQGPLAEPVEGQ